MLDHGGKLLELEFGLLPLGYVLYGTDHAHRLAVRAEHEVSGLVDYSFLAARQHYPVVYGVGLPVIERLLDRVLDKLPVSGVNGFYEGLIGRVEVALIEAENAVYLVRPPEPVVDDIPVPASHVRYLLGLLEALPAFSQGRVALAYLGGHDVEGLGKQTDLIRGLHRDPGAVVAFRYAERCPGQAGELGDYGPAEYKEEG